MEKMIVPAFLIVALAACAREETQPAPATDTSAMSTAATATTSTDTAADAEAKTYTMVGVLVSRDAAKNTVNIDNEDIPGVMAPMKMDYELRGSKVDTLPPDGSKVQMTLHDHNGTYWVTDVKPRQ